VEVEVEEDEARRGFSRKQLRYPPINRTTNKI
jgi:hypothetical protein